MLVTDIVRFQLGFKLRLNEAKITRMSSKNMFVQIFAYVLHRLGHLLDSAQA